MEMILFLDFRSSGTEGSGRELWLADCESLGPPPWLLILTGGAGGLSSHRTLSHIYTGVHLHVWQRHMHGRQFDDWNEHGETTNRNEDRIRAELKTEKWRVESCSTLQLSEDQLDWESPAQIAVFGSNYYFSDIFPMTSFACCYESESQIQWNCTQLFKRIHRNKTIFTLFNNYI